MKYRPELDGLRALAVVGVFLFHLDVEWMKGGWLGVDIFFVLSGYLISSILLREMDTGGVSLSRFYLRRTRRILPALLVCLIGTFPIALLFSQTTLFTEYLQSVLAALFSASNIYFWQNTGYFASDSQFVLLLHTWTLGVEEQFYLVIPALFLLLAKLSPKRRKVGWTMLFLVTVTSFLVCRYGRDLVSNNFNFYMLPTRMWQLAIGTFVALLLSRFPNITRKTVIHEALGIAGVGFIVFAFTNYVGNSYFAEKSLFVGLAASIFIISAKEQTLAGRLLSLGPIRFVGKISYSMYLWHWPMIVLWNILVFRYSLEAPFLVKEVVIITATTAISAASWRYVETPFRSIREWPPVLKRLTPYTATAVACILVGFLVFNGNDATFKLDRNLYTEAKYDAALQGDYPHFGPEGPAQFMLIGDSHAQAIAYAFEDLARENGVSGVVGTHPSTSPLVNLRDLDRRDEPPYAKAWLDYIQQQDIKQVILAAFWDQFFHKTEGLKHIGGKKPTADEVAQELRELVLSLLQQGREVWVMDQVPMFKKDPVLAIRMIDDDYTEKAEQARQTHFASKALSGIDSPRLHILNPWPLLTDAGMIRVHSSGNLLWRDDNHLSPQGARELKPLFQPIFTEIKRESGTPAS